MSNIPAYELHEGVLWPSLEALRRHGRHTQPTSCGNPVSTIDHETIGPHQDRRPGTPELCQLIDLLSAEAAASER